MKTLEKHTIIYDEECPMCNLYTRAFLGTGMLDKDGRAPYSSIVNPYPLLDMKRAKNEIALINKADNTVTYGIYSLFKIIGHSFPVLKPLFNLGVFQNLMKQIYSFISFNRKVIVPGTSFEGLNSCTPTMHAGYRTAYIVFSWFITSWILFNYSGFLQDFVPVSSIYREFLVCGGQIIFQGIIVAIYKRERTIHYLGNLMTVSLGGSLLLLPIFALEKLVPSGLPFLIYFMFVAGLMFLEHARRVKILELPFLISISWVAYRLLVLFVIL